MCVRRELTVPIVVMHFSFPILQSASPYKSILKQVPHPSRHIFCPVVVCLATLHGVDSCIFLINVTSDTEDCIADLMYYFTQFDLPLFISYLIFKTHLSSFKVSRKLFLSANASSTLCYLVVFFSLCLSCRNSDIELE